MGRRFRVSFQLRQSCIAALGLQQPQGKAGNIALCRKPYHGRITARCERAGRYHAAVAECDLRIQYVGERVRIVIEPQLGKRSRSIQRDRNGFILVIRRPDMAGKRNIADADVFDVDALKIV